MSSFQFQISVFMIEIEIASIHYIYRKLITSLPILHVPRSPVTNTNVTDVAVCPLTDETRKFIKDAQDFTSLSLYSQTRRYKHSHIFGYKQAYINVTRIGHHLCCAKRQLENSPSSALFMWLVGPRLG